MTAHTHAPATGLWKEDEETPHVVHDEILIYEVMVQELDRDWWQKYREELEERFEQESLVIRATHFERL